METLSLADGEELTLQEAERKFNMAMAAPEPDEDYAAEPPKRRTPREPAEENAEHRKPRVTSATGSTPGKRPGRPSKSTETPKAKDYTEELTGLLQLGYGALCATGNLADAGAVKTHGPSMVAAWNAAAQENPMVRRGVEWLTKGGVWGAVVVTTMPLVLQVMANHGQVETGKVAALGVKNPEALAAETMKDIEAMAAMAEAA